MIDITGQTFGRWTAISRITGTAQKPGKWFCKCQCGNSGLIGVNQLRSGRSKSCGCLAMELKTIHGHARKRNRTPTYQCWYAMVQRCTNPHTKQFHDYGGRGITLCDEWLSFENFLSDMGERPHGLTLDRIDNDKGYNKDNCRWATITEQQRNKRNNHYLTIGGTKKMLVDWARENGLEPAVVRMRIRKGWDVPRAITQPVMHP